MITTSEALASFLNTNRHGDSMPVCAIDTEADSLHRYKESLCLVQFASRDESKLIDPLAIDDMSALGAYLDHAEVWMHGADYDMTMLKREFGRLPKVIYDTQVGARLLGLRKFGLGDLVEHYFGIVLNKSSQKADWGMRPLSEEMLEYAIGDVKYLLEMGDKIVAQLKEKGRYEWFLESCVAAQKKVMERDDSRDELWRIKGSGKFDIRALCYLRALWYWRDEEAKLWDKPTFMVTTNANLLEWAYILSCNHALALPKYYRADRIRRFNEKIDEARAQDAMHWPKRVLVVRRKKDAQFDQKVDEMVALRNQLSLKLDIDPSLIISRSTIEALAAGESSPEEVLLPWQLKLLKLA